MESLRRLEFSLVTAGSSLFAMRLTAPHLVLTLLIALTAGCQTMTEKNTPALEAVSAAHPKTSLEHLRLIEGAFAREGLWASYEVLLKHHRIVINDAGEIFEVHVGSPDPYAGGSGANYEIHKTTGALKHLSTETYAPEPE